MPIRLRLGLAFAAVTCILVLVGGALFLRSFQRGVESSLDPGLRAQAADLRQNVRAGLVTPGLQDTNGGLLHSRDEVAQVLTASGELLATTSEAGHAPLISARQIAATAHGPVIARTTTRPEDEPFRALATRVDTTDGERVVVVAASLDSAEAAIDRVERALLIGGAIAVTLAGLGGVGLAWAALRPVERLRNEAADISEHDADARLQVPRTHDEIAALATTMNRLLERLHAAVSRERAFVADAGHELRTPLSVLRMELELANRPQRSRDELRDAIRHAVDETDRLSGLAEELLLLASTHEGHHAAVEDADVEAIVQQAVASTRARAEAHCVELSVVSTSAVSAPVVPDLLRRAVDNLLDNALRYSPPGGGVVVSISSQAGEAVVRVADQGPGFPPEFLPHAFERFRRADDARARVDGGSGLGLAIVDAIALTHGGSADAANGETCGAVVSLHLPQRVSTDTPHSRTSHAR
jgi:heavy metal sensor kinase